MTAPAPARSIVAECLTCVCYIVIDSAPDEETEPAIITLRKPLTAARAAYHREHGHDVRPVEGAA